MAKENIEILANLMLTMDKLSQRKVDIQIGKQGLTENILTYLKSRLKHSEILKVRVLKSAIVDKDVVEKLAIETGKQLNAHVRDVRGNTFIISRT